MQLYSYPSTEYFNQLPYIVNFYCSFYSLINKDRTRDGVQDRAFLQIQLPLPKEPGYELEHLFGEGGNRVGPIFTMAGLANSGGLDNIELSSSILTQREAAPALAEAEFQNALSTFRRFANFSELTMHSEARKVYKFAYIFVPKNALESQAIEDIVGSFRKCSYPSVATGLPERTYPQNLWVFNISKSGGAPQNAPDPTKITNDWFGDPLVCVLKQMVVKKNDRADPITRLLPSGYSNVTLLGLVFEEFETGSFDSEEDTLRSKSEISYKYFGQSETVE